VAIKTDGLNHEEHEEHEENKELINV